MTKSERQTAQVIISQSSVDKKLDARIYISNHLDSFYVWQASSGNLLFEFPVLKSYHFISDDIERSFKFGQVLYKLIEKNQLTNILALIVMLKVRNYDFTFVWKDNTTKTKQEMTQQEMILHLSGVSEI